MGSLPGWWWNNVGWIILGYLEGEMMSTQVKERPILFNAEMVRAVLDGRKTVTRRVVKGAYLPLIEESVRCNGFPALEVLYGDIISPYGAPGDKLWVRETWAVGGPCVPTGTAMPLYRAGATKPKYIFYSDLKVADQVDRAWRKFDGDGPGSGWTPSIHMPRWASRILLEVVSVKVERVQEITLKGICDEGLADDIYDFKPVTAGLKAWETLWDSINAKRGYGWNSNPYVWVVEFKVIS